MCVSRRAYLPPTTFIYTSTSEYKYRRINSPGWLVSFLRDDKIVGDCYRRIAVDQPLSNTGHLFFRRTEVCASRQFGRMAAQHRQYMCQRGRKFVLDFELH